MTWEFNIRGEKANDCFHYGCCNNCNYRNSCSEVCNYSCLHCNKKERKKVRNNYSTHDSGWDNDI